MTTALTARYLVSTDLDGTLLDHHNYDWQAASDALRFLKTAHIPLIFNTSKTLAEGLALQHAIGVDGPLVVENGSALAIPIHDSALIEAAANMKPDIQGQHALIEFGKPRRLVLDFIQSQRQRSGDILSGYNDWDLQEISNRTGLSEAAAQLSAQKLFSEPFIWQADEAQLEVFTRQAAEEGFKVTKGGRFFHIQGDTDKSKPILWLKEQLEGIHGNSKYTLVCLGDNDNDVAMLNAADIPVCVRSPTASYPQINDNPNTINTQAFGPQGWQEAMSIIFPESTLHSGEPLDSQQTFLTP